MAAKKYLWDDLFKRARTVLLRGDDYDCSQSTMSQQIRNEASKRGLPVKIRDEGMALVVEVQLGRRLKEKKGEVPHTDPSAVPC